MGGDELQFRDVAMMIQQMSRHFHEFRVDRD